MAGGIQCLRCGSLHVSVYDSRAWYSRETKTNTVRRRRSCDACDHRWTTVEIPEDLMKLLNTHSAPKALRKASSDLAKIALDLRDAAKQIS